MSPTRSPPLPTVGLDPVLQREIANLGDSFQIPAIMLGDQCEREMADVFGSDPDAVLVISVTLHPLHEGPKIMAGQLDPAAFSQPASPGWRSAGWSYSASRCGPGTRTSRSPPSGTPTWTPRRSRAASASSARFPLAGTIGRRFPKGARQADGMRDRSQRYVEVATL